MQHQYLGQWRHADILPHKRTEVGFEARNQHFVKPRYSPFLLHARSPPGYMGGQHIFDIGNLCRNRTRASSHWLQVDRLAAPLIQQYRERHTVGNIEYGVEHFVLGMQVVQASSGDPLLRRYGVPCKWLFEVHCS